jgi:hypothetical protein
MDLVVHATITVDGVHSNAQLEGSGQRANL